MGPRLEEIRNKYVNYRHKLFGHNDKNRMDWIDRYNAAGFTYQSIEEDFEYLDYVYKYLWQLNKGETLTDEATARNFHFPHNQSRHGVIQQTEEFLRGLAPIAANISSSNERCKAD